MNRDYISAVIPEPVTILGLRLRPFCIGHYQILSRFDCSYVSEKETVASREDLIFAVLVCSMSPADFIEWAARDEKPTGWQRLLAWCLRKQPKGRLEKAIADWGRKIGVFDFAEKSAMFQKYLADNSKMPRFWEEEGGKASGAHWSQSVMLCLTSKLGYTHKEAEELPLSQAFHDFLKHAESEGSVRLMTEEEIDFLEKEAANGVKA